jgi:cell wall-associated NlpC family hydrolase
LFATNQARFALRAEALAYVPGVPRRGFALATVVLLALVMGIVLAGGLLAILLGESAAGCDGGGASPASGIVLGSPGSGQLVGATEYGGPGDPSSGTVGASGANLLLNPDTYAELGGSTFQTATAMGGLPYMTPLRVSWGTHSAIAYKRDFGLGGGPVDGLPRVIDLWWQFAGSLGIPYENGLWSGPVRIARPPAAGAGNVLAQTPAPSAAGAQGDPSSCSPDALAGVPLAQGERAQLLPDGLAAAPADAPTAVKGMIAAGNQIVGKPYLYGGGHGIPLSEVAPSYDCSSSVEHLLYGGGLLPVTYDAASGTLESFGEPGPGRWVTIYASADHVFMYVAGLRWDTHNAAGPDDGSAGIGWHPLLRSSAGFVVRHPAGL